ncbi:MAG: hypothetical protein A3B89_04885 [Candidatus Buchananbacteria bacterium RIFCSPHIGHO2_02_FULL_40_13]|uniref:histidine kinase n=1 Tax=Candidatus Buchananbacteria bacterium RIFCSPLOWO2_01_FULL_39_33 TaxID=1797543 RepID=A0A1G1YK56_9BACT|nr:MAG: hypothetical protein A3B89_04885 [Candidatus Buchananbacteria bacterium RIFCSPHIGHO2_02_FULL_40_13]OGY52723.1 MAG: hypothetical protein A3A02_02700 [Candidatus Buchananbacteria bacterium RIFCSPLOWO2_01_FULL_39_33]
MTFLMFVQGSERSHRIWGIFCITVFFWGIGVFKIASTADPEIAIFWWRIGYIGVIFIPIIFTHFVYEFLKLKIGWYIWALYLLGVIFLYLNLFTDLFIGQVRLVFNQFYYISSPGLLYSLFFVLFIVFVLFSHIKLWQALRKSHGILKVQLKYFFLATIIGFSGGTLSFLPVFNINLYPFLNLTVFLYPIIMGYAIFKHHLMNIRVIATELFSGFLVIVTFVKVFFYSSLTELFLGIAVFLITVIFSILLIQLVLREVNRREQMEILTKNLQKVTKDLKVANNKIERLDQAKLEFLSIASHQLRTPLTVIKGYVSMMLEGNFGPISKPIKENLNKIYLANERLISLVESLLNISRIEAGRLEFNIKPTNLVAIIAPLLSGFKEKAKEKNSKLNFLPAKNIEQVLADAQKIKEVLTHLLDNAIKYTNDGTITLRLYQAGQSVVFSCQDTGRNILAPALPDFFDRFIQKNKTVTALTQNTNLGLYFSQMVIEKMGGKLWVESAGANQGNKFYFSLPGIGKNQIKKLGIKN